MSERYRPANGTEGIGFQERWCMRCALDDFHEGGPGCPILAAALAFDVDDKAYPTQWVYTESGNPCCTAFVPMDADK